MIPRPIASILMSIGKDGRAGVVNEDCDGISPAKDAADQPSVLAREHADFKGPLFASVERPDGSAAFEYPIQDIGTAWEKFRTTFTSSETRGDFRLVNTGPPATGGWQWKETIGPIEQRRANQNVSQDQRRTRGLGFHEYLQMPEDPGTEPVFSVHAENGHPNPSICAFSARMRAARNTTSASRPSSMRSRPSNR